MPVFGSSCSAYRRKQSTSFRRDTCSGERGIRSSHGRYYAWTPGAGSSSSDAGGTRHTDSSHRAAATSPAAATTPRAVLTVSPLAACNLFSAGATCARNPAQIPAKAAPTYALAWASTASRATSIGSTGRTGRGGSGAVGFPRRIAVRASRSALSRERRVRAPRASAIASTASGAGSHQSSGGRWPYQARTRIQEATARPTARTARSRRRTGFTGRPSMQVVPSDDGGDLVRRPRVDEGGPPAVPGQHRGRIEAQPRHQHEGALVCPGVRQSQLRIVGQPRRTVVRDHRDDVHVEAPRAPADL